MEGKRIYQQRRNLIPSSFVFSSDSFHVLRFLERRIDYLHNRMKLVLLVTLLAVLYTVQYSNSAAVRSEVRYISTVYHNRCICWNKNRWSRWLFDREFAWIIWFFFFLYFWSEHEEFVLYWRNFINTWYLNPVWDLKQFHVYKIWIYCIN